MHPYPTSQRARLVLLVEDNADAQIITSLSLRHLGFEVLKAGTLAEAARIAELRHPDVVVLDCHLPDGDGLELARRWRTDPGKSDIPIIVLTAFSARQDLEAALLAGADAFLVKPCEADVLAAHIERVVRGRRPSQALRAPL